MPSRILVALFSIWLGASALPAHAQENQAPASQESATPQDPFALPEGNDSKALRLFLERLARTPPTERTLEGHKGYLNKIEGAISQVLSREIDQETKTFAIELRVAVLNALVRLGDENASEKLTKFFAALKADKQDWVRELAGSMELQYRIANADQLTQEGRKELFAEIAKQLQAADKTDMTAVRTALQMTIEFAGSMEIADPQLALAAYKLVIQEGKATNDESLTPALEMFQGTINRLELLGNPIEISGTTLAGEKFDIKQYQGKVVLIDFWATWCGPCRRELPHLRKLYSQYHDKGFEIVGISLDEDADELKEVVEKEQITWVTLFDGEGEAWANPNAQRYGISALPSVFLADQSGKVISLQARGEELTELLEKLLGPAPEEKPAAEAK